MQRSGTRTYFDPETFQADIRNATIALTFTGPGKFRAKQTWIRLNHLNLLQIQEDLPRIGYLSLPSNRIHLSFPSNPIFNPIWGGIALRTDEIVVHGATGGVHDRTTAPNCWNIISIKPQALSEFAKYVAQHSFEAPTIGRVLRPTKSAAQRLIHLHRKVSWLKPDVIGHPEVGRALESEFLEAICGCLLNGAVTQFAIRDRKLKVMADFEALVSAEMLRPLTMPMISEIMGVAERTLRAYCANILGMSPNDYIRLRRLNRARAALQHADPRFTSIEQVAHHHQFGEAGRFAVNYRKTFGESPSSTLLGASLKKA